MNRRVAPFVALATVLAVFACGGVPTFDGGIAYISPVILPAPAVAAGDQLRDSAGHISPITIQAYDENDRLISGAAASFVVSTVPAGVTVDASGVVTALDSIRTVQIVGRIGDRLQTPPITLDVVAQPDSIAASGNIDSLVVGTASSALQALVTGARKLTRVNVKGIIVRYRIAAVYPNATVDPTRVFFADVLKGDLTRAADTTDASGLASRPVTLSTSAGIDSVRVEAMATNLRGVALKGSPVRFILHVKKGS